MSYVIGIDSSTTATKAQLVDSSGAVVAVSSGEYDYETPQPLWSEQQPALWWTATQHAVSGVLAKANVRGDEVAAVGLTGQMHGLVLLDDTGTALRPAFLWNDQRTGAECDEIRARVGKERLIDITGNDALTGFTAPKILWVRNNEPEVFDRARHVLLPKDYVRYSLTGEYASDRAGGAGTILFDLKTRTWSDDILAALDLDRSTVPDTFEGHEITGRYRGSGCSNGACRSARRLLPEQATKPPMVWRWRDRSRCRWLVFGNLRRRFHATDGPSCRARRPSPRVLSRRRRPMALHGSHALCSGQPSLVPRSVAPGIDFADLTAAAGTSRRAAKACCSSPI